VELAFDTAKLVIFDADTGANLTIPPAGAEEQAPPPPPSPEPDVEQSTPPAE
jgi:multiple sugar transport system ATP-binding protein